MLLGEVLRTCANRKVAKAAVQSIGQRFACEVEAKARRRAMGVGQYVSETVAQFARCGDEAALRSVRMAMEGAQEPVLAGLQRVMSIAMAAEGAAGDKRLRIRGGVPSPYVWAADMARNEMLER